MKKNLTAVLFVLASIYAHAQVPPPYHDKNIDGSISEMIGKGGLLPMPVALISGTATLAEVAHWGVDAIDPIDPNATDYYKVYQYSADCAPAFSPSLVILQLPCSGGRAGAIFFNESGKGYKYIGLTDPAPLADARYKFVKGYCQNKADKARFYMLNQGSSGADKVNMWLSKISADGMKAGKGVSLISPKDEALLNRINDFYKADAPLPSEDALLHSLDRDPPVGKTPLQNK